MDNYGIDCIFMNNDGQCDMGNDTCQCLQCCSDQVTFKQYEEKIKKTNPGEF